MESVFGGPSMMIPKVCPNCGGKKGLLYADAIYFFVVCGRCGMSGARALSQRGAVSLWNERGSTAFTYEAVQENAQLVRIMKCDAQRTSKRYPTNLPVVLTLFRPTGKKVTGVMRNVSPHGAFLQFKGGIANAMLRSMEDLLGERMFLYFKRPVVKSADENGETKQTQETPPIQQLEFIPKHFVQSSEVVGVGGNFKSPDAEQLSSIQTLLDFARNR